MGGWRGETIAFPDPAQRPLAQGWWVGQHAVVAGCENICRIVTTSHHLGPGLVTLRLSKVSHLFIWANFLSNKVGKYVMLSRKSLAHLL